jgi:hypothetical protein
MPHYLNPQLSVERAGPVLEREFRQRFGDQEYERLYRTINLRLQEQSTDQEQQIFGVVTLIGTTTERVNLFLAIIWLSKKEMADPTAQEELEIVRHKTVAQLLRESRKAVQESEENSLWQL